MTAITLKTARRKTSVSKAAIQAAVSDVYAGKAGKAFKTTAPIVRVVKSIPKAQKIA